MSNPISDWIGSICETFGWSDDDSSSSTQTQAPPKAQTGMAEAASAKAHDALLENKQCTDEGQPAESDSGASGLPTDSQLKSQLAGLKQRLNAITRRVHTMIDNGPTAMGRPTDPVVIQLNQKQMDVGYDLSQTEYNWDKMTSDGRRLGVASLAGQISQLECDVQASGK